MTDRAPLLRRDRGASAVEYALLAMVMVIALVGVIYLFGGRVTDKYSESCNAITNETGQNNC